MSDFAAFGQNLRDLLAGLLLPQSGNEKDLDQKALLREIQVELSKLRLVQGAKIAWGPKVDRDKKGLKELFAGTIVKPFTATAGGIDNLALSSTDVFVIPGRGEFSVDFDGYFQVTRDDPTTNQWHTSEVFVNMTDLNLRGKSDQLGPIHVRLNDEVLSAGQVFPSASETAARKCRIATGAEFEMPALGLTVFNKEPILLKNDGITSVPPVEDPNGLAHLFELPLFDKKDPNGRPVAYLKSLKYTVGNYITPEKKTELKGRR